MKKNSVFFRVGILCILVAALLFAKNRVEDVLVGRRTEALMASLSSAGSLDGSAFQDPRREMPIHLVDGHEYIGHLKLETLGLDLPVMSSWSYDKIKIAPARYQGSIYRDNMIIMAHNYRSHFGKLPRVDLGDEVTFTDVDQNQFHYEIVDIQEVGGDELEALLGGEWDLTLFTCTLGGKSRVVVRCKLTGQGQPLKGNI
ncbi:MAG: sortase [Tissierellia bacterium]|nr:sortase [Tissierellia bacterium]